MGESPKGNSEESTESREEAQARHMGPEATVQNDGIEDVDSEMVGFNVDFKQAFRDMSINKYESLKSMIREYISNMVSTCLEAQELLGEEYEPRIEITYYPESERLVFRDNGMGMDMELIEEVGTEIGYGKRRHDGDKLGRHGIGLLSGFVAVGEDGSFYMHSRLRQSGEYLKGVWVDGGFQPISNLESKLPADEYGTRFEFSLIDNNITIESAVADIAEHTRVPVLYRERDESGVVQVDDEFPGHSGTPFVNDNISEENYICPYDTEHIRVIQTNDSLSSDCVLLDVPIDPNGAESLTARSYIGLEDGKCRKIYGNLGIYIKTEKRVVVSGPHSGLVRVSDAEYSEIPVEYRDEYIPDSRLSDDDIWIPQPSSDRDRLEKNPEFWEWLAETIVESVANRVRREVRIIDELSPLALTDLDKSYLLIESSYLLERDNLHKDTLEKIAEERVRIEQDYVDSLRVLSQQVRYCENPVFDDDIVTSLPLEWASLHELSEYKDDEEITIWSSVRPTKNQATIAYNHDPDSIIVKTGRKNKEKIEDWLQSRELGEIGISTVSEFDVDKEVQKVYKSSEKRYNENAGKDAKERVLTLHMAHPESNKSSGYTDLTDKLRVEYLKYGLDAKDKGYPLSFPVFQNLSDVVLFPPDTDKRLTDFIGEAAYNGIRLANCTQMVWDYLADTPNVHHIDDIVSEANRIRTKDSKKEGDKVGNIAHSTNNLVIVSVLDDFIHEYNSTEALREHLSMEGTQFELSDAEIVVVSKEELQLCMFLCTRTQIHYLRLFKSSKVNKVNPTKRISTNRINLAEHVLIDDSLPNDLRETVHGIMRFRQLTRKTHQILSLLRKGSEADK